MECGYCNTLIWYQERKDKHKCSANPKYNLCCGNDKIELPFLKHPLQIIAYFPFDKNAKDSKFFQTHFRTYSMMFAFTPPGAKLDNKFNNDHGSSTIRIQGQSCH